MAGDKICKPMSISKHQAAYDAQYGAERAQASLLRRTQSLVAIIPPQVAEHHGVQYLLDGVKEDVEAQELATKMMLDYIPRQCRRPPGAAAPAQKVFGTPELLESVLLMVDTRAVFNSCSVSKDWFTTIEGSIKLQRILGLRPDADAHVSFKANSYLDNSAGSRIQW